MISTWESRRVILWNGCHLDILTLQNSLFFIFSLIFFPHQTNGKLILFFQCLILIIREQLNWGLVYNASIPILSFLVVSILWGGGGLEITTSSSCSWKYSYRRVLQQVTTLDVLWLMIILNNIIPYIVNVLHLCYGLDLLSFLNPTIAIRSTVNAGIFSKCLFFLSVLEVWSFLCSRTWPQLYQTMTPTTWFDLQTASSCRRGSPLTQSFCTSWGSTSRLTSKRWTSASQQLWLSRLTAGWKIIQRVSEIKNMQPAL